MMLSDVPLCCTASLLMSIPYDDPDGIHGSWISNGIASMEKYWESDEWKKRPRNRSVIAYVCILRRNERIISSMTRQGFKKIGEYRTDGFHTDPRQGRYMVGIFLCDSPDNIKDEELRKKAEEKFAKESGNVNKEAAK